MGFTRSETKSPSEKGELGDTELEDTELEDTEHEEVLNNTRKLNEVEPMHIKNAGNSPENVQKWFAEHVTLDGEAYTLDQDQAAAVLDRHQNTLVTARAGSGKTRVIVAKVAYLVSIEQISLREIAIFMFNRTAAAEVNQRIARVEVDGKSLPEISEKLTQSGPALANESSTKVEMTRSQDSRTTKSALARGGSIASGHGASGPEAFGARRPSSTKLSNTKLSQATYLQQIQVASTFHKKALDIVKMAGLKPEIIDDAEHVKLIRLGLARAVAQTRQKLSPAEYGDLLKLTNSFIARAGQKFCGENGINDLRVAVEMYVSRHSDDPEYASAIRIHQLALMTYLNYLEHLRLPKIDFNLLMQKAIEILEVAGNGCVFPEVRQRFAGLKYIMIDEYQDFSYLFYAIVRAMRGICKNAKLFVVGDDWQAINRFAGSDVDYFLNFQKYFPDDFQNISLLTNYRSDRAIVENANDYMLANYDQNAKRAIPFSKKNGKIYRQKLSKTKFDTTDILEDGLGDGRYQKILIAEARRARKFTELGENPAKTVLPAAKMLKVCAKIIKQNTKKSIMLLHRHNFTTVAGVDLVVFERALERILVQEYILNPAEFKKQVRIMTMHKSKGLEAGVVILLELDHAQVLASHPFATMFEIFGDDLATEKSDQHRLLYVALTRAKHKLYILTNDQEFLA